MFKISKTIQQQTRQRVRMLRTIDSIMKRDSHSLLNPIKLKKELFKSNDEKKQSIAIDCSLRSWAIEYHIQNRALSALLKILISFGLKNLPRDSRTLLKTPRTVKIEKRAGGQFWYNGITNCIKQVFGKVTTNTTLELNFNVDGLPLFKSSPLSFWPILANIQGLYIYIF